MDNISCGGDEGDSALCTETYLDVLGTWFNHSMDVYDNVFTNARDDAIETDGIAVNMRVFRNRLDFEQNAVSVSPVLPGPIFIVRNVATTWNESCVKYNTEDGRGTIRNIFFYHNTFVRDTYKTSTGVIMTNWTGTPSKNIVFRGNILQGPNKFFGFQDPKPFHQLDMDYDLWYSTGYANGYADTWSVFHAAGLAWETHGVFSAPALNSNLTLPPTSPAVDKAILVPGINANFFGNAPDIGAAEVKTRTVVRTPIR